MCKSLFWVFICGKNLPYFTFIYGMPILDVVGLPISRDHWPTNSNNDFVICSQLFLIYTLASSIAQISFQTLWQNQSATEWTLCMSHNNRHLQSSSGVSMSCLHKHNVLPSLRMSLVCFRFLIFISYALSNVVSLSCFHNSLRLSHSLNLSHVPFANVPCNYLVIKPELIMHTLRLTRMICSMKENGKLSSKLKSKLVVFCRMWTSPT